jgi:hypothetical protein
MRKNKTNTTWPGVHKTNERNNKMKINYRARKEKSAYKLNAVNKITPTNNNILNRFVNSALD